MVLDYQTGRQTSTATLNADPNKRWQPLYVDEIDKIAAADPASTWGSANNYNASCAFSVTVELCSAVDCEPEPARQ